MSTLQHVLCVCVCGALQQNVFFCSWFTSIIWIVIFCFLLLIHVQKYQHSHLLFSRISHILQERLFWANQKQEQTSASVRLPSSSWKHEGGRSFCWSQPGSLLWHQSGSNWHGFVFLFFFSPSLPSRDTHNGCLYLVLASRFTGPAKQSVSGRAGLTPQPQRSCCFSFCCCYCYYFSDYWLLLFVLLRWHQGPKRNFSFLLFWSL